MKRTPTSLSGAAGAPHVPVPQPTSVGRANINADRRLKPTQIDFQCWSGALAGTSAAAMAAALPALVDMVLLPEPGPRVVGGSQPPASNTRATRAETRIRVATRIPRGLPKDMFARRAGQSPARPTRCDTPAWRGGGLSRLWARHLLRPSCGNQVGLGAALADRSDVAHCRLARFELTRIGDRGGNARCGLTGRRGHASAQVETEHEVGWDAA